MWELTSARCTPEFWADDAHTVTALRDWKDHDLEKTGRLTHPMRYSAETDRYEAISWNEAFTAIGATLKSLPRESAVFYASGHAGLEASYLYALLARAYGNNNLPQSFQHVPRDDLGRVDQGHRSPVGTIVWEDLAEADAFFFFGQKPRLETPRGFSTR